MTALICPPAISNAYGADKTSQKSTKSTKSITPVQSFTVPDFAFPKTVSKNASSEFEKALNRGDADAALRAAIQLDVAEALVNRDTYGASIDRFEELSKRFSSPYRNLALLLEAQLYVDIYNSNAWNFNRRTLPADSVPTDVLGWDGQMFRNRVESLVGRACSDIEHLEAISLSDITNLLTDDVDAVKENFSVADFIALKSVSLLQKFGSQREDNILPLKTTEANYDSSINALKNRIVDQSINANRGKNLFAEAYFSRIKLNMLKGDSYDKFLKECFERYGDTPAGAYFVSQYVDTLSAFETPVDPAVTADSEDSDSDNIGRINSLRRKQFEILSDYFTRFPEAYDIQLVYTKLISLQDKNVNVSYPSRMLPDRTNLLSVEGSNIYDFYILAYLLKSEYSSERCTYAELSSASVVRAIPVKISGSAPDMFSLTLPAGDLEPGCYAFIPSATPNPSGIYEKNKKASVSLTLVSNISVIKLMPGDSDSRCFYVVSSVNQKPIANAKVTLWPVSNDGKKGSPSVQTTDAEGMVTVPKGSFQYLVEYGGNSNSGKIYKDYNSSETPKEKLAGTVLTDLAVYRPKEKVQFSAVTYLKSDKQLKSAENVSLQAMLIDANRQHVDSLMLTTDEFGRCSASFDLPASGLLGSWSVAVRNVKDNSWLATRNFQVAEYKAPTFYVTCESASDRYELGSQLKFEGRAMTYSGMPVGNAQVKYVLSYEPFWWRRSVGNAQYGGETTTAADGSFVIELPTEGLRDTEYAFGRFVLTVDVTDGAGETRESAPLRFSFTNPVRISAAIPGTACADSNEISFKVAAVDFTGAPVKKEIYYDLRRDDVSVSSGSFDSPRFKLDTRNIKSGRYLLRFSMTPDFKATEENDVVSDSITIWRSNDRRPPILSALWVPETNVVAPAGSKNVKIKVGSSYDQSYILAAISDSHHFIRSEWIRVSDGFATVTVDTPADDERLFVTLLAERDLKRSSATVTVIPYSQTVPLVIEAESFRDRVNPGAEEQWKFRFSYDNLKCPSLPAMAVMSNKALNDIVPFSWQFNPSGSRWWSPASRLDYSSVYNVANRASVAVKTRFVNNPGFTKPEFNTYGYSLYGGSAIDRNFYFVENQVMYKSAARLSSAGATEDAVAETASEDMAIAGATDAGDGSLDSASAEDKNQSQLRDTDCQLAFFMPELITDNAGIAELNFSAPDFVGTWQLQILGYTPSMKGAVFTADVLSSKKVMAQLNAPRFVRTGDKLEISAVMFNNQDNTAGISGRIEFVDPATNRIIASKEFGEVAVSPSESRTVTAEFDIPTDLQALIVRAYALTPGYSDGEQDVVAVYPATTPVVESRPFYMGAEDKSVSVDIPGGFGKDGRVALKYCDNAVWECILALPAMMDDKSANVFSIADALYGNAMATGICRTYPEVMKGILHMDRQKTQGDSALYSALSKNSQLKTVLLNNTPWVNNANSETIRMQRLVEYADTVASNLAVRNALTALSDRQSRDGGWSWCPGMKSSSFVTARVINVLASLASSGYLPVEGKEMAVKACRYVDNEYAEEWNRNKQRYLPLSQLVNYLNDKSRLGIVPSTSSFKPLEAATVKKIESDWRNLSIADKATAAMVCENRKLPRIARLILESINQYATTSPEMGMWFANGASNYASSSNLIATARVLQAFSLIEPSNPAVNQLRQWLVLSKQTQNWGTNRSMACVIDAILSSGDNWVGISEKRPEITLNGCPLDFAYFPGVGEITINLPSEMTDNALLTVAKSSNAPAWGGVVSQRVEPIEEVKAYAVPQLSIEKNIYVVNVGEDGRSATSGDIKVGDKVRVTLTIICDRDIEYVAVTDERAACLEPVNQLSEYTIVDGVWMYRETRDQQTNLYIPRLTKGTHVISYECNVDRAGEYSLGIATAQSQYAPEITAHSSGTNIISSFTR